MGLALEKYLSAVVVGVLLTTEIHTLSILRSFKCYTLIHGNLGQKYLPDVDARVSAYFSSN